MQAEIEAWIQVTLDLNFWPFQSEQRGLGHRLGGASGG